MNCTQFLETLVSDRRLRARLALAAHRRRCPKCRVIAQDADVIAGALAELPRWRMPVGLDERLLATPSRVRTMSDERPRRRLGRGTKLGLVAAAIAVAAAGWLALHRGEKQGALAQALEEVRNAETIHFVARPDQTEADRETIEFWIRDETHFRQEKSKDGKLSWVCVQQGDVQRSYTAWSNTYNLTRGQIGTGLHDFGQLLLHTDLLLPSLARHYQNPEGTRHTEERIRDEDGRDAVRHTLQIEGPERVTFSTDAKTGRIMALECEALDAGTWRRVMWFDGIEYNIPIPDEVFRLEPPEGATVLEYTWWETRKHQVLAEVGAEEGIVLRLHSVDVRDDGDVIVSLSEHKPIAPDGRQLLYQLYGRLVDDQGRGYAQLRSMGCESDNIVADRDGQLRSRSAVYYTLTFTPVDGRAKGEVGHFDIELPPLPGAEDDGPVLFAGVEANQLPPGDPFSRLVSGNPPPGARTEEQLAVERLEAIDRYRQAYPDG